VSGEMENEPCKARDESRHEFTSTQAPNRVLRPPESREDIDSWLACYVSETQRNRMKGSVQGEYVARGDYPIGPTIEG
jgi:hypothetical protein